MIRSIAAPENMDNTDSELVIRRNLQRETLTQVMQDETPVWVDMTDTEEDELVWLQQTLDLHPLIMEDLRRVDTRPTMLAYTDTIFLSLFQPKRNAEGITATEIHCIIGETAFITVRHGDTSAIDEAYDRAAKNPNYWERDMAYFLYLATQAVVDAYYPIVDRISNILSEIEEELLRGTLRDDPRRKVYKLTQQLISLRRMVAPQREVLSKVIGEERLTRTDNNRDLFRHLYERLMRIYDIIDSQRDIASNVLDLIESHENQRLGRAVNRLTIFSMIFFPLTFITGLFELNFISTTAPFELPVTGTFLFVSILVSMVVIVTLMVWYFRRQGWL
ncbi:MAG: magnesium transporter CorA family protein [Chloroflexota bacterium]